MTRYTTISAPGDESLYTEKRSRFIGRALPVRTVEEALAAVEEVRAKYRDARHVCWAFRLGHEPEAAERSNDDGEPSGTAGRPLLGRLIAADLRDVLVVVVRYYGGINLGTGRLAVAYRTAAEAALATAPRLTVTLTARYRLTFPFDLINPVMMLLRVAGAEVQSRDSDEEGHLWTVTLPLEREESFVKDGRNLYRLTIEQLTPP